MSPDKYLDIKQEIINRGYSGEIDWSEDVKQPADSADFVLQFIWVVCNSGMKNQIAEKIYKKILTAICDHVDISDVFGHEHKVKSIKEVIKNQKEIFKKFQESDNKIEFCKSLPHIGNITKYHLAKNLGVDCVKPDRHLVRIAKQHGLDVFEMCQKISDRIGDKLSTVDLVIWRAANLGLI
jgi:ribonucleotide reductase beta subunit family protein with ferritin-like domain